VRIEAERDIERLRQVALLLQAENGRLHERLAVLAGELARARGEDAAKLQLEIEILKEQLAARTQALFGASSEKTRQGKDEVGEPKPSTPRNGHGPREQVSLPIVEQVHELDAADQACPKCGGDLAPWTGQYEESEEIDVVERSFKIVRHRRQKYRCSCGECIETALGPPKLIPGGRYSIDFAVEVAIGKYADHLPLARQVRQMGREGLRVDTQTLWDQIHALSRHLEPSYEALHGYVLSAPVVGADETSWRLMGQTTGARAGKSWWVWAVARPDAVVYRMLPSRSAEAAKEALRDFAGIVMADGLGSYGRLRRERDGPPFHLVACWAHVRRKFHEASEHHPKAREGVEKIGKLYEIESRVRELDGEERLARLAELRDRESRPVVNDIRDWLLALRVLPRSSFGTAVRYALDLWAGLTPFLDDARIPIDNNATERALRGVAVGRKNHYGSRSIRGTRTAAIFYSLIESAKLAGLEPRAFLREATRRAIAQSGSVTLPRDLLGH
jgi:transposase